MTPLTTALGLSVWVLIMYLFWLLQPGQVRLRMIRSLRILGASTALLIASAAVAVPIAYFDYALKVPCCVIDHQTPIIPLSP